MAASVDAKLLRATKFPPEFNQKVDMQKVNLQVMKKWIASRISEILGSEDDVVIELCFNLIDGPRFPDIKSLQIQLTGFLDKDTAPFCKELWKLCLSAQSSPQGVPKELLEAKKLELIQEKIDADKAAEEARIENDETVASVEVEGTTGVEADAVEIELSMIAEDSDAVQIEADLLPEEIAIHIKETVIAMCLRGVAQAGKTLGEGVPPPVQHLQTRGAPLGLDVLGEALCGLQVQLDIELATGLRHVTGNESDHLAEIKTPEAAAIVADTTLPLPILILIRKSSLEPISIIVVISIAITITIPQSKETISTRIDQSQSVSQASRTAKAVLLTESQPIGITRDPQAVPSQKKPN
ncbi:PWI domain-containing protein [Xylaria castorea]|nr:PWI domain-containing protein [Xylaria castorea]